MNYAGALERTYDDWVRSHLWDLPEQLNLGDAILQRGLQTNPEGPAIIDGKTGESTTFRAISDLASAFSGHLRELGAQPGDRVAVIAPQSPSTLAAHIGILRAGMILVPLSQRYGPDALRHRLADSGTRIVVATTHDIKALLPIKSDLPDLQHFVCVDAEFKSDEQTSLQTAQTAANDPALMIYTSGTTGAAKGAVHGHRVLEGHLPGFHFSHGQAIPSGSIFYTPADWAWAGGLLNLLYPALALGFPVVSFADAHGFRPQSVATMMRACAVTHAFLPPTALKMMRAELADEELIGIGLKSVMSAGEALGRETYQWAENAFGFPVSEAYGQTECNLVIGSSAGLGVARPGATGKPTPGHTVFVVREDGTETRAGEAGEIAIASPDPVMFLGYWKAEFATERKFREGPLGRLLMTGDMALRDMDGYIWFIGRDDDVITSSGHRIGPAEIEDCLVGHPSVSMAAVVGVPDPMRTEIVRAFVVLRDGIEPTDDLKTELRAHVRAQLAAHEYPREIRFLDALPMTTTGKVIRRLLKSEG
ncbi:MAG: AMP-binding protein [Pseudomonadota bacterium]